jgi:hypothetical protein
MLAGAVMRPTGPRRNSDTSATMTGATAAPISVPGPQIRAIANDAPAEAALAMTRVSSETPERLVATRSTSGSAGIQASGMGDSSEVWPRCQLTSR